MSLREWRIENKVTLADMSEALSVSVGQLSHLELGNRKWSVNLAKRVEIYTRGRVTAASLLGISKAKRARFGVREDAEPYTGEKQLTIELALSADQSRLFQTHGVDIEAVARVGAEKAMKEAEAKVWAETNREAIDAYNIWIEKHGTLAEQFGTI